MSQIHQSPLLIEKFLTKLCPVPDHSFGDSLHFGAHGLHKVGPRMAVMTWMDHHGCNTPCDFTSQDSIFLRDSFDADLGSTITPPPLQVSEFTSAFRNWSPSGCKFHTFSLAICLRSMDPNRNGTRHKTLTYADVVRTLNDPEVKGDINDACAKLAQAMVAMMPKFDSMAKQLHTVDLLRRNPPLKPRWEALRKKLADMLWQYRNNAGMISGRLKLLSTAVLPMAARNSHDRSPSYNEGLQVLRSYMNISESHFELATALVEQTLRLSSDLINFLSEFNNALTRHTVKGQKEMCTLSQQLAELANYMERLLCMTRDIGSPDCSHVLFTSSRLVLSSGLSSGRSKLTRHHTTLHGDIAKAYEHTERKRNEVAHVQYAAHLQHNPSDPLSSAHTSLCALILEELLITESALNFFLSIRSLLRYDCIQILHWLKDPGEPATPIAISCYLETLSTLYTPLASGLDVFVSGLPESVRAR